MPSDQLSAADGDWLCHLLATLQANPGCAVGGTIVNGFPDNVFAAAWQVIF
jgi:hypothetical protein